VAVGDGSNDLLMMAAAGVGIAYRAKPIVQEKVCPDGALITVTLLNGQRSAVRLRAPENG